MTSTTKVIAPGARIVVRDAEWIVRRVDAYNRLTPDGPKEVRAITAIGVSEIVKDKESIFIDEIEGRCGRFRSGAASSVGRVDGQSGIEVLDAAETMLVPDDSPGYRKALLYIESNLRRIAPSDGNLYVGHKAAMDPLAGEVSRREIEYQERQLLHVAATRAKKEVFVSSFGKPSGLLPSESDNDGQVQ